jgi:hypothetical protein
VLELRGTWSEEFLMTRHIRVDWPAIGISVTADITHSMNPKLSDFLWNALPYNSIQNHAIVSGHHLYHLCPFRELVYGAAQYKEDRTKCPDGTVFLSHLQHLAIKYGELSEYIPAAAVGQVVDGDIAALKEAGRACWEATYRSKKLVEVRVTQKDAPAAPFLVPRAAPVSSPTVQALIDDIQGELERVWVTPPPELVNIHEGRIPSRAGSYDQYFATMVFVNGETRPLGYGALGGLVKSCQLSDIDLATLRQVTPNFIRVPAEFLGYCGLERLWDFTQRTIAVLGELRSKAEYLSLISTLALYANRLNGWNLHLFPWHHGDQYRYATAPKRAAAARSPKRVDAERVAHRTTPVLCERRAPARSRG